MFLTAGQAPLPDYSDFLRVPGIVVSARNHIDQLAVRNGNPAAAIARAAGFMNLGHILSLHQFLATRISIACNVTVYHRENLLFAARD